MNLEAGSSPLPLFKPCPSTWKMKVFHWAWNFEIAFSQMFYFRK
jgi:hypothetical protein